MAIEISASPGSLALVSLPPARYRELLAKLPEVPGFVQLTRDVEEITLILAEDEWARLALSFPEAHFLGGRRLIQFDLVLDFSIVGFLAEVTRLLAAAGISVFAISTWRTDAILVAEESFDQAVSAIRSSNRLGDWETGQDCRIGA